MCTLLELIYRLLLEFSIIAPIIPDSPYNGLLLISGDDEDGETVEDDANEEWVEKVKDLESQYSSFESKLEDLTDSIHSEEEVTDDEEETSELSKDLRRFEEEENREVADNMAERDVELCEKDNEVGDKSLFLEQLERSTERYDEVLDELFDNLSSESRE